MTAVVALSVDPEFKTEDGEWSIHTLSLIHI